MFDVKRVLVPVDFSGCSISALRYAARLAEHFGAAVEILHVYRPPDEFFPAISIKEADGTRRTAHQFARKEAQRELGELVRREVTSRGAQAVPVVACGDPTEEVVIRARSGRYDLVIMGTHGRTGLAHWLLGSVAESVLRRSACPVLTIRPASMRRDAQSDALRTNGPVA
jgi:nucleotide-binding universal stress UspA family protein